VNVHKLGLEQGCLISCEGDFLADGFGDLLQESRAICDVRTKKPIASTDLLLVLSQDCDLVNAQDKYIEVIPVKAISGKKINEREQRTRNFRKLQLSHNNQVWLLESEKIAIIPKESLPVDNATNISKLGDQNLRLVLDWRVGRYNRRPLPDNFNRAFLAHIRENDELGSFLEENRYELLDLYVYVDPMKVEDADKYRVIVVALINQECEEKKEVEIREMLFKHWEILHQAENCLRMGQIDQAFAPEFVEVNMEIVARLADFTFLDNHLMSKVTLDYLCYEDPVIEPEEY